MTRQPKQIRDTDEIAAMLGRFVDKFNRKPATCFAFFHDIGCLKVLIEITGMASRGFKGHLRCEIYKPDEQSYLYHSTDYDWDCSKGMAMNEVAEQLSQRIEEAMTTLPSLIQEVARFNAEQEADELLYFLSSSDDIKPMASPATKSRSL
jgi:hypothetical protein